MKEVIPLIKPEEVIPRIVRPVPVGPRPIIPIKDTCCIGVCTIINRKIDYISKVITERQEELGFIAYGTGRIKVRRQIDTLTNQITALKDFRIKLKEKNICKCIE